jgi:acyl phosphate:glycerol-3-phosphate acyltransferase
VSATAAMTAVAAYLVGGIPIGLLVARARGVKDIRQHGSGNIGASNVQRVLGTKLGLLVWVADLLKGLAPVLLARYAVGLEGWGLVVVGLATALGHCFSPFLRFAGGRAVSTSLGAILGLYWLSGVAALALFVLVVARTRYISLGSIVGGLAAAPLMWLMHMPMSYVVGALGLGLLIALRHIPNIQRLLAGTERKIGQKAAEAPTGGGGPDAG